MTGPDDDLIDAELRRAFAPPPDQQFAAAARAVTAARHPRWPWLIAAAAAAALVIVSVLRAPARGPEGHDAPQLAAIWRAAYEHAVNTGFGDSGCCSDTDLASCCQQCCGERLVFDGGARDGVRLLGRYAGLPTGGSLCLMLRANGQPVCVFVVPRGNDPRPDSVSPRLSMSRRELGPLVLYSLARSAAPDVLDDFAIPRP